MNYSNETLRNALAAEYVLGTLRGGARKRFKQLILSNQGVAETVWLWEQYLNGMGESLPPVAPDDKVWQVIQTRLGFIPEKDNVTPIQPAKTSRNILGYALIAASIFIAVLVTTMQFKDEVAPVTQFAVVNDAESNPIWLIEISDEELIVRPTNQLAQLANNDYQLWIVPASGDAPVSLGVLPQSGKVVSVAPDVLKSIPFSIIAVSKEPLGGSPTGQPTEVLFTANINTV